MELQTAKRIERVQEYYFARKLQEIEQLKRLGVEVINLGIGNPDMPPPDSMVETLSAESWKAGSHGYQGYRGTPELRRAIARWYADSYYVALDANLEILPLMGSKEGIMHISMALLNEGDEVLVPDPGYPVYRTATEMAGGRAVTYTLIEENGYLPDFVALEQTDLSQVKIMWVNYPNMPTGARPTLTLFQKLIDFGRRHGILICHDNPYSLILNPEPMSILQVQGAKEVAIELNSLSKSHNMAGWRVGMMVGNTDVIAAVLRFKTNMDSGMPLPVQLSAASALGVGREWYVSLNAEYHARQRVAMQMASEMDCAFNPNQSGMFLWVKIPPYISSAEDFSDEILKQTGVFITPGTVFGANGEGQLRISLCSGLATLQRASQRLCQLEILR